jgi:hypothetical protein
MSGRKHTPAPVDIKAITEEIDGLKAENARLAKILREVRYRCHYEADRDRLHSLIWPLVIDFDCPVTEGHGIRG